MATIAEPLGDPPYTDVQPMRGNAHWLANRVSSGVASMVRSVSLSTRATPRVRRSVLTAPDRASLATVTPAMRSAGMLWPSTRPSDAKRAARPSNASFVPKVTSSDWVRVGLGVLVGAVVGASVGAGAVALGACVG